jgi:hypothetical protein
MAVAWRAARRKSGCLKSCKVMILQSGTWNEVSIKRTKCGWAMPTTKHRSAADDNGGGFSMMSTQQQTENIEAV